MQDKSWQVVLIVLACWEDFYVLLFAPSDKECEKDLDMELI